MKKTMLDNDSGIAYALVYMVAGIIMVGAAWIICGMLLNEFNVMGADLVLQDLWTIKTTQGLDSLTTIYDMIPWLLVGSTMLYGIVTAIRKERGAKT